MGDDELSSDEYIEYRFTDTIRVDKMSTILYLKMRQGFLKYHQMQKILSRECQLHSELEYQKKFDNFLIARTWQDLKAGIILESNGSNSSKRYRMDTYAILAIENWFWLGWR